MCGFIVVYSSKDSYLKKIYKMNEDLHHRGPDAEGYYYSKNRKLCIGHKRLSIIGLDHTGNQPFVSECNKFALAYNGEIYNFLDIKSELNTNFKINWKSKTDTEVLFYSLQLFGYFKTLKILRGMYSFIFYNELKNEIFIGRDQFGQKPIYYGINDNNLYIASELKPIINDNQIKNEISEKSVNFFFKLNYIPSPFSIFRNFFKLKPQHFKIFDLNNYAYKDNLINQNKYELPLQLDIDASRKNKYTLKDILENSVERHMIADVDVGCYLSSGIDSSILASIMQKKSMKKINTFSFGFDNPIYDESILASKIANYIGSKHHILKINKNELIHALENINNVYSEPFSDSSQIPTYILSKYTSKFNKVVLSGEGGDELFGGYNRYIHANKIEKLYFQKKYLKNFINLAANNINFLFHPIEKIRKFLNPQYNIRNFIPHIIKVAESINSDTEKELYLKLISHWPDKLFQSNQNYYEELDIEWDSNKNLRHNMMNFDLNFYLTDDLLVKTDRASMANSLEIRAPYLDYEVYCFSKKLDHIHLFDSNGGKKILKDTLKLLLPDELISKSKKGFLFPIKEMLLNDLKDWSHSLINNNQLKNFEFINFNVIQREWDNFIKGKPGLEYMIWDVVVFSNWLKKNY